MNQKYRSSSFTLLLLLPHGDPGPRNQFLSCRPVTFDAFIESPMTAFHGCHTNFIHCNPHHLPNHPFPRHPFHTATHQQPFPQHPSPLFPHTPYPFVNPAQSLGIDFESTRKCLLCLFDTEGTLPSFQQPPMPLPFQHPPRMADAEPSPVAVDRLEASMAKLAAAQLRFESTLDALLLKLSLTTSHHYPSSSSVQSPPSPPPSRLAALPCPIPMQHKQSPKPSQILCARFHPRILRTLVPRTHVHPHLIVLCHAREIRVHQNRPDNPGAR